MPLEKNAFVVGELCFDAVWTKSQTFLICTTCHHWVRKYFLGEGTTLGDIRGQICFCACHRPSVARLEEDINNGLTSDTRQGTSVSDGTSKSNRVVD